jgi:hypothetical protein
MVTYFELKGIGVRYSVDLFACLRYITKNIQNMGAKKNEGNKDWRWLSEG